MWTVVYMAQNKDIADRLSERLTGEGLLIKLRPLGKPPETCYEVLVPQSEIHEAHSIIIETGF